MPPDEVDELGVDEQLADGPVRPGEQVRRRCVRGVEFVELIGELSSSRRESSTTPGVLRNAASTSFAAGSYGFARAPHRDWTPVPGVDLLAYELAL